MHFSSNSYRKQKEKLQIKETMILDSVFTCVVTFTGILISLYDFKLLFSVFLLQPDKLPLAFLLGQIY